MNLHELAEERSLALHEEVARRLRDNPALLRVARARVEDWLRKGSVHSEYGRAWREILCGSVEEIGAHLRDRSERARALRQVSPFAGVVSARRRWEIWREVRERMAS
jgi:hypothetical protein